MTADTAAKPALRRPHRARNHNPRPTSGRPAYEPTTADRAVVKALCGFGLKEDAVAEYLDIDPKTLRKHFGADIRRARPTLMAMAAGGLMEALQRKEWHAIRFVHATLGKKMGWTESVEIAPSMGWESFLANLDMNKLDDEQFKQVSRATELLQLAYSPPSRE